MKNHQNFDRATVHLLGGLYESFPNQSDIDSSKDEDPRGLTNVIEFWHRSGLVTVGQTAETFGGAAHFFFVGLTLLGLTALRSSWPDSNGEMTLGERMIEASANIGSSSHEGFSLIVKELLKYTN